MPARPPTGARTLLSTFPMCKLEQMENELRKLSQPELRQIRAWLEDIIEDEMELPRELERTIKQSEQQMSEGG